MCVCGRGLRKVKVSIRLINSSWKRSFKGIPISVSLDFSNNSPWFYFSRWYCNFTLISCTYFRDWWLMINKTVTIFLYFHFTVDRSVLIQVVVSAGTVVVLFAPFLVWRLLRRQNNNNNDNERRPLLPNGAVDQVHYPIQEEQSQSVPTGSLHGKDV